MAEPLNPELTLTLRVEEITELADDIRQFRMSAIQGALPPFTPGAHILVQTPSGATRRYSLANAPHEGTEYVIAVKLEPSGRGGSRSMFDGLAVGDTLTVSFQTSDLGLWVDAQATIVRLVRGRRREDRGEVGFGLRFDSLEPVKRLVLRGSLRRSRPPLPRRKRDACPPASHPSSP
jgi:hypothetical protein